MTDKDQDPKEMKMNHNALSNVRLHTREKRFIHGNSKRYTVGLWHAAGGYGHLDPLRDFDRKTEARSYQKRVARALGWECQDSPLAPAPVRPEGSK